MTPDAADWTCGKCTASNPLISRKCWNCSSARLILPGAVRAEHEAQSELGLRDLLVKHIGEMVVINFQSPSNAESAYLVAVHSDYFSVSAIGGIGKFHYPIRYVLSICEAGDLQIEVYRQVFVKGAIGVGITIPI